MTEKIKILATAYDFSPQIGGISNCAESILKTVTRSGAAEVRLITRTDSTEMPFPMVGVKYEKRSWMASLRIGFALIGEIKRNRPDVTLHFLWWPETFFAYFYSCISSKPVPYFIMVHGMEILESKRGFWKIFRAGFWFLKKAVLQRATGLIAVSKFTADLLQNRIGIENEKINIIYLGADPAIFFPSVASEVILKRFNLAGKKIFLTVTRLDSFKGVDHFISALKNAIKVVPNLAYLVVGSGPDEARLKKHVASLNLQDYVQFAGKVLSSDLIQYYHTADCFVLLSREEWDEPNVEGFGISILEAAACGKPALVGKSGGMEEAIEFGKTGWSVDPNQISEIEKKIIEIATDENGRSERGQLARERVESYFNWDRTASDLILLIRQRSF